MKSLPKPRATRLAAVLLASALAVAACGGNDEKTLLASARSHLAKQEVEAARLQLKTLLQDKPQSAEGRLLLGQVMNDTGDPAGAEAELRRALELGQSETTVLPLLAEAMVAQNKGRQLLAQFGKVELPDAQADAALRVQRAKAAGGDGDFDAAEAELARVLARQADHAPALLLRARLAAARGDAAGALAQVDALLARNADNADAWMTKGELLQRTQPTDRAPAMAAFQEAVKRKPDLVAGHVALLGLMLAKPDVPAAQQQWAALQKVAPKHGQTLFFEAVLAEQRGDLKRARELTQLLLRATPDNPQVLMLAGQTELRLNALAQAEAHFTKVLSMAPKSAVARRRLAQVQVQAGQPDKALATLRPLTEANPPDPEALTQAAQAQLIAGDTRAADATFARLAQLKPTDTRTRTALALTQVAQGKDTGLADLQAIAAADPGTVADMALVSARLLRGDFAGAAKAVDALAAKMPGKPLPDQLRGRIALARKDAPGARKAFEQALAKDGDFMPALAGLAMLDLLDKQPAAAKTRFEALLARNPNHTGALLALAEIGARSGAKSEETAALLERAIKSDPTSAGPRQMLIDHQLARRQTKAALAAAQAAVAALPDNTDLLDRLGRVQLMSGDGQQAVSSFNKLAGLMPKSALPHLRLADAYAASGNPKAMAAAVRRAGEVAPGALPVQQALAKLALMENKPDQALAIARAVQAKYPDDATGFGMEGDIELRRQQWDAAAAALRKAMTRKAPGDSHLRLYTALTLGKKTAEAEKLLADHRKAQPADVVMEMHVGDLAMAGGDMAGAERQYRVVLERQPDHLLGLNNLAFVLASQKKAGAVALAEKALALAPDTPAVMDTLALCLAAEQQLPRALEVQAKAVAAAPDAPQFRLQLAKLQLQAGDKPSARTELDKLAKLGAAYPRQAEVAALIKSAGG